MAKGKGGGGGHNNNNNKNKNKGGGGGGGGQQENWHQQFLDLQGQFNTAQQGWQDQQSQQQASDANAWWQPYVNPEPQQNATAGGPSAAEQGYGGYVPTVAPAKYNVTPPAGQPPMPQIPAMPAPVGGGYWNGRTGGSGGQQSGGYGGGYGGHKNPGMGRNNRRNVRQGQGQLPAYGGQSTQPSAGIGDPRKRKKGIYY